MNDKNSSSCCISSRSFFWWVLDVALIVAILAGLSWMRLVRKQSDTIFAARSITVSAEGKAIAVPDIALLTFSVTQEGTDPKALQEENTKVINRTLDFVKSQGVSEKDVKTTSYTLSPRYDYDRTTGRSSVYGYTLSQTAQIKIRDFSKIGPVLGQLPDRGVNRIDSFAFAVDEEDRYLREAREKAFEKAAQKAEEMAAQNGVRLGRVITFTEGSDCFGGCPMAYSAFADGAGMGGADQGVPAPKVEPGTQEVTAHVSVTYELK